MAGPQEVRRTQEGSAPRSQAPQGFACSCRVQIEDARAEAKLLRLDTHALRKRDEEVREHLLLRIDGDVASVLVSAAGEHERQVLRIVRAGVAEIGAEEHSGAVEQRAAVLLDALEL